MPSWEPWSSFPTLLIPLVIALPSPRPNVPWSAGWSTMMEHWSPRHWASGPNLHESLVLAWSHLWISQESWRWYLELSHGCWFDLKWWGDSVVEVCVCTGGCVWFWKFGSSWSLVTTSTKSWQNPQNLSCTDSKLQNWHLEKPLPALSWWWLSCLPWLAISSMFPGERCPYSAWSETKAVSRLWLPLKMSPVNGIKRWPFCASRSGTTLVASTFL